MHSFHILLGAKVGKRKRKRRLELVITDTSVGIYKTHSGFEWLCQRRWNSALL